MEKDFCEYCNATLPDVEKLVTVYRHWRGQHFIFERVSARVCTKCCERYFSAKSVGEMQREMNIAKQTGHFVSVPVIELQPVG
jgi:YgiT-type zinc finger domain-containing protein